MIDWTATLGLGIEPGAYATADDLLLLSDLSEVDLVVKRWTRNGQPLRIRVKALDFDQQEACERGALVMRDGQAVRSAARFAALTLFESVIVPKLSLEQAHAMRKHNPAVVSEVVSFIWNALSTWNQAMVEAIVNEQIPGATDDPPAGDGGGDAALENADRILDWEPAAV